MRESNSRISYDIEKATCLSSGFLPALSGKQHLVPGGRTGSKDRTVPMEGGLLAGRQDA